MPSWDSDRPQADEVRSPDFQASAYRSYQLLLFAIGARGRVARFECCLRKSEIVFTEGGRVIAARASAVVLLFFFLSACSGKPSWLPSNGQAFDAAHKAVLDPATWLPAVGAVAFGVTGLDDNIADWASDRTPLFGNQESASDASDHLRDGLTIGMVATAIFAPVNGAYRDSPGDRVAANALAFVSAEKSVEELKGVVGRERPDGSNDKSFPSGHTVKAVTSAALIRRNLATSFQSSRLRAGFNAGMIGVGALTGWARIEADKHYPSDVLTSAALGNFFTEFFYRALVQDEEAPPVQVAIGADGLRLDFAMTF